MAAIVYRPYFGFLAPVDGIEDIVSNELKH